MSVAAWGAGVGSAIGSAIGAAATGHDPVEAAWQGFVWGFGPAAGGAAIGWVAKNAAGATVAAEPEAAANAEPAPTAADRPIAAAERRANPAAAAERPPGPGPGGGDSPAAAYGRAMHKAWDYGPGFEKEVRLPSGSRVDAVNWQTHEVVELKPNIPRAIQKGEGQILRYLDELNEEYGGTWSGGVETYQ